MFDARKGQITITRGDTGLLAIVPTGYVPTSQDRMFFMVAEMPDGRIVINKTVTPDDDGVCKLMFSGTDTENLSKRHRAYTYAIRFALDVTESNGKITGYREMITPEPPGCFVVLEANGCPACTCETKNVSSMEVKLESFRGPKGDRGETGPIGPQGPKGEKGDKGDRGEKGDTGPQGETGAKGDAFTFDDFTPEQLESLRGPKGDTGATGPQGTEGAVGPQGPQGAKGEPGKDAVIDATLTQEGEAADAKATGEAINQITGDAIALSGKLEKTEKRAERAEAAARYAIKMQQGYTYDCKTVVGSGSEVDVPVGTKDYAGLRKIGGMSRKGYQVLPDDFPASSSQLSVTKNGNYNYTLTTLSSGTYRQSYQKKDINGLAGTYTLHAEIVGTGGLIVRFYSQDGKNILQATVTSNAQEVTIDVSDDFTKIEFVLLGNTNQIVSIGSVTTISDIMLEPGNTAHHFEPYTADLIVASIDSVVSKRAGREVIHTTALPTGMLALCPDYGQGTAESYNYIDFEAKSYHHVGSMTQNGVWTALDTPEIIDLSAAWVDDLELLTVASGGTVQMHYPKLDEGFELAVPSEIVFAVDIAKAVKE
jgi:hypothetical protein